VAKPKIQPPKQLDVAAAASQVDTPRVKWKVIGTVVAAFAVLWVTALMMVPALGYWGVGGVGVLSVVAIGFGIYILRMTRKQNEILDLMKGAGDSEGRERAIAALAGGDKDAMKQLAHAQLVAQKDPAQALEILKAIDIKKAPAMVQDEVRAQLAMMYLFQNRPKDARPVADEITVDRQPDKRAKAKYAAVVAEAFARTGKAQEARELVDAYDPDDEAYAEDLGALLLRARVYTYTATKNRGLARKAMDSLVKRDPNMVAPFMQKGTRPELQQLAKQSLQGAGLAPRQQMKMRTR
jgi:hypothetical protein